jgi:hypothetical protein
VLQCLKAVHPESRRLLDTWPELKTVLAEKDTGDSATLKQVIARLDVEAGRMGDPRFIFNKIVGLLLKDFQNDPA